jgi:hypothetical protein
VWILKKSANMDDEAFVQNLKLLGTFDTVRRTRDACTPRHAPHAAQRVGRGILVNIQLHGEAGQPDGQRRWVPVTAHA